jgi:AraC-like DNA-binding protein
MLKDIALLSPIYISLFWSIVLLIQPGKRDDPKINLGFFMIFGFLIYCSHAIFFSKLYHLYSYFEGIYIFSMLSVYPLYYNYLLLLTTNKPNVRNKILRFLPAFIFSLLALFTTLILTPDDRILYVKETLIDKNLKGLNLHTLIGIKGTIFFMSRGIFLIQVLYFGIKGVQLANKLNKQITEYYSNTEGKTLHWVRLISIIIIVAALASISFTFIGRSYFSEHEVSLLIPSLLFSTFLFIIGFKGNQQIQVNSEFMEEIFVDINDVKIGQKEKLKKQLVELFESNKIYKNVDLRIVTVSEILKTNRTYISKLINEEFKMNFNEFVNQYRIEEAKLLLSDRNRERYTLEYIAEKSGFGSVSSFTRVFKSINGQTPGKFK